MRKGKDEHGSPDPNSVYGELKLSEKLQLEIYALREDRSSLNEQVESLFVRNRELEKQIAELKISLNKSKVRIDCDSSSI